MLSLDGNILFSTFPRPDPPLFVSTLKAEKFSLCEAVIKNRRFKLEKHVSGENLDTEAAVISLFSW